MYLENNGHENSVLTVKRPKHASAPRARGVFNGEDTQQMYANYISV